MIEIFEAEIKGKTAICYIKEGDLHAKFLDGSHKIYHNMRVNGVEFELPKDLVKQEIVFTAIPEEGR